MMKRMQIQQVMLAITMLVFFQTGALPQSELEFLFADVSITPNEGEFHESFEQRLGQARHGGFAA